MRLEAARRAATTAGLVTAPTGVALLAAPQIAGALAVLTCVDGAAARSLHAAGR